MTLQRQDQGQAVMDSPTSTRTAPPNITVVEEAAGRMIQQQQERTGGLGVVGTVRLHQLRPRPIRQQAQPTRVVAGVAVPIL